jgi:hypothetical protein
VIGVAVGLAFLPRMTIPQRILRTVSETGRVLFVHESLSQRIRFATGGATAGLVAEVERLGAARVMLIAAPAVAELADLMTSGLPIVLRHDQVVMHVPLEVAEKARAAAIAHDVDLVVSVGGGSTTGLAKAVAMTTRLPIVAVTRFRYWLVQEPGSVSVLDILRKLPSRLNHDGPVRHRELDGIARGLVYGRWYTLYLSFPICPPYESIQIPRITRPAHWAEHMLSHFDDGLATHGPCDLRASPKGANNFGCFHRQSADHLRGSRGGAQGCNGRC